MTIHDQLDLFAWAEEHSMEPQKEALVGANVVAFPLHRDVGRIRKVAAAILKRRSPQAQQAEFNRAVDALARKLRAAGLHDGDVHHQMASFARAVNSELMRIQLASEKPRGIG